MPCQGTVVWRARVPLAQPMEHMCWYFGAEKVGFIYPISCDTGVWTFSAPLRYSRAAAPALAAHSCVHVTSYMHSCMHRFNASINELHQVDDSHVFYLGRPLVAVAGSTAVHDVV